nr:hypothetical protein [Actinomycetota bacterium]
MRFYAYTPGEHGYISAEVAIRDLMGEDEARGWADDWWKPGCGSYELISRAEALMVPTYRDALEWWERRDDAILQDTEVAPIRGTSGHPHRSPCTTSRSLVRNRRPQRSSNPLCPQARAAVGSWRRSRRCTCRSDGLRSGGYAEPRFLAGGFGIAP